MRSGRKEHSYFSPRIGRVIVNRIARYTVIYARVGIMRVTTQIARVCEEAIKCKYFEIQCPRELVGSTSVRESGSRISGGGNDIKYILPRRLGVTFGNGIKYLYEQNNRIAT